MLRSTSLRVLALLVLATAPLGGCGVPSADGPADTYGIDFSLPEGSRTDGAIIFMVDGVSGEVFDSMLAAGELPAIKKYMVDRGTYCPAAVANTPSVTISNLASIATGQFPGHHGVVGVNWFDRNQLIWRNYDTIAQKNTLDGDYIAPTIYEQFPDRLTFSVFFQPHRGATKFWENWTSAGPPFYFGWYEFVDRLTLWRLHELAPIAREYRQFPAVTVVYLLAPDFRSYVHGTHSAEYRESLKHTDYQIGRVLGDLQRAGLLDKVHVALVSDHGHTQVTSHFDITKYMEKQVGLKIARNQWWENAPFEDRLEDYRNAHGVLYGSGDRYWAVCLRRPIRADGKVVGYRDWLDRPTPADLQSYPTRDGNKDLLAEFVKDPAVDAIAYAAGEDVVRVRRADGEVEFRQPGGRGKDIAYRVIAGRDPLGYAGMISADAQAGTPLPQRQWLEQTSHTRYPDLPAQILAYFRATRRAADIAVFAAPAWDFRTVNKGGHGGLRPEDMLVPLIVAGPGVPHRRINHARTVDLVPTILSLLGKPLPPDLDGQPIVPPKNKKH